MIATLQIDENLLQEALVFSEHSTATQLVENALREYIQRRKQIKMLDLFETIKYEENYDYKQQRQIG